MRSIILGLLTAVALVLGTSAARAQDNGSAPPQSSMSSETTSGTVVSSDANNLTITMDSGRQMKFAIDASAAGMPTSLQAGTRVDVTYMPESSGDYIATKVMLSSSGTGSGGGASGGGTSSGTGSTGSSGSAYDNTGMGNDNGAGGSVGSADRSGATTASGAQRLPRTASPLPLIGITGLIALGGSLAFRLTQRS